MSEHEPNGELIGEFTEHQQDLREWRQLRDELTDDQEKWGHRDKWLGRVVLIAMGLSVVASLLGVSRVSFILAAIVIYATAARLALALIARRRVNRRVDELAARITARSGLPPAQSDFLPNLPM